MAYEPDKTLEEILKTVTEMRSVNDQRVKDQDILLAEKDKRLDEEFAALRKKQDELFAAQQAADKAREELETKLARDAVRTDGQEEITEERKAFRDYILNDVTPENRSLLKKVDVRSMSVGSKTDGGYLAPNELDLNVIKLMRDANPWRQVATVRSGTAPALELIRQTGYGAAGWTGEASARTETTTPQLGKTIIVAEEAYALTYATQTILEDGQGAEQFLMEDMAEQFNQLELAAFTTGNGAARPLGLFSHDTAAQTGITEVAENKIGYIKTGSNAAFSAAPFDDIRDLITALRNQYRARAKFMMTRLTEAKLAKTKDSYGQYLWQPAVSMDTPATITGFGIINNDVMPHYNDSANTFGIAFGDFSNYVIYDRRGIVMLRDPYSSKPYVQFYATKRVGGAVRRCEAFKFLQFAA